MSLHKHVVALGALHKEISFVIHADLRSLRKMEAIEVHDIVIHEDNLYIVQNIDLTLGFSIYEILSVNSPNLKQVTRLQIEKVVLDLLMDVEGVVKLTETEENSQKEDNGRFYNPKQQEIDAMKAARLRESTERQTKWAVKIIKGKFVTEQTTLFTF